MDDRLRDFFAEEYLCRKRDDDALRLIWAQFAERPCMENYQKLHRFAGKTGLWQAFRQQVLEHLERLIAGQSGKRHYFSNAAVLVEP